MITHNIPRPIQGALVGVLTVLAIVAVAFAISCSGDNQQGNREAPGPRAEDASDQAEDPQAQSVAEQQSESSSAQEASAESQGESSAAQDASTPPAPTITIGDGDLIRAVNTDNIFRVKVIGEERYKRLILNPTVFNSYGWNWNAVKDVPAEMLALYTTSDLVRVVGDNSTVYRTAATGGDAGTSWIVNTATDADYNPNAVFLINAVEFNEFRPAPQSASVDQEAPEVSEPQGTMTLTDPRNPPPSRVQVNIVVWKQPDDSQRSRDARRVQQAMKAAQATQQEPASPADDSQQAPSTDQPPTPDDSDGAGSADSDQGSADADATDDQDASDQGSSDADDSDQSPTTTPDEVDDENVLVVEDGDLIRAVNTNDIFLVKVVGEKAYKRLILSPAVFNSYSWNWNAVKDVPADALELFTDSGLVRLAGSTDVYALWVTSEDTGIKTLVTHGVYDPDSVYTVNRAELAAYASYQDPRVQGIEDGDLIRAVNTDNIFLVKVADSGKRYKRLILNPTVFNGYGWDWGSVQDVPADTLTLFATSDLVRLIDDTTVYRTIPTGADTGGMWRVTTADYDPDSVFVINGTEAQVYIGG